MNACVIRRSEDFSLVTMVMLLAPWWRRDAALEATAMASTKVERIYIFDATGARYEAKLLGKDDNRDIALLQIAGFAAIPLYPTAHRWPSNLVNGGDAVFGEAKLPAI